VPLCDAESWGHEMGWVLLPAGFGSSKAGIHPWIEKTSRVHGHDSTPSTFDTCKALIYIRGSE